MTPPTTSARPGAAGRHTLPTAPEAARPAPCAAPQAGGGPAAAAGVPGAPAGAHPAYADDLRRTTPARRPGRTPTRATTPTAGASLPADRGRAARESGQSREWRESTRVAGPSARNPQTGPEGHRTTGEGA
ncbi:hypothetical protein BSL84_28450 [Streptomyces sp. TN58]|nr:hypothetical protein BSL84_28450 [Streptomyces sp. TN58]